MEQKVNPISEKLRRARKMMLKLPLMVVPLLCLVFYGLGGGKGEAKHSKESSRRGLNMTLPEARLDPKKKALNKLGVYKQAEQDSIRLLEKRKLDPYYNKNGVGSKEWWDTGRYAARIAGGLPIGGLSVGPGGADEKANELLQKLDLLKGVLSRQGVPDKSGWNAGKNGMPSYPWSSSTGPFYPGRSLSRDTGREESLAGIARTPVVRQHDTVLDQLSGLMDKILRVQRPEEGRLADTTVPAWPAPAVAELSGVKKEEVVKMLVDRKDIPGPGSGKDSVGETLGTGFMNFDDNEGADHAPDNLIGAVIARDQTLISGESVELRLSEETVINDVRIPAGTLVAGKASLSGERLLIAVSVIRVGKLSVPVSLEVVDLDGVAGIKEKGSINRDVAKQSADEAISTMGVTAFDPSLGGQAAAAGLQAAKTLMSRKARLVRVGLTAGYQVWLKNTKTNR